MMHLLVLIGYFWINTFSKKKTNDSYICTHYTCYYFLDVYSLHAVRIMKICTFTLSSYLLVPFSMFMDVKCKCVFNVKMYTSATV